MPMEASGTMAMVLQILSSNAGIGHGALKHCKDDGCFNASASEKNYWIL
jgi:hypothetical protein